MSKIEFMQREATFYYHQIIPENLVIYNSLTKKRKKKLRIDYDYSFVQFFSIIVLEKF